MTAYYVLVFGILSCFFGSVIYALHWSIRHGQFSDYQRGAASIFDEDEPIGQLTDCFPDTEFPDTESPDPGPPKDPVSSEERE